jgi:hypothetical protein
MMIGYDIYDRFTMEHFPLCQNMILTTSFFLLATVYRVLLKVVQIFYHELRASCRTRKKYLKTSVKK